MNRLDRITAILLQLQARRTVRAQDLAARYAVNVRTIYRDLRTLEEAGVPLSSETGAGFSLAEGYRLPPVMFTREEASALLTAEKLAAQFTDPHTARLTQEAMDKLRAALRPAERDFLEDVAERILVKPEPGHPAALSTQRDVRQQLLTSLGLRQVVRLAYRAGYHGPSTNRDVEPIGLYFRLHWHLVAYCRLRQEVRDFRLDRITSLQLLAEHFAPRPETLPSYWEQQRAEYPGQQVVLRFTARGMARVRDDKYLFGWAAEEARADGTVDMTLLVHSLPAVAHWLLYFGEQVSIVSPPALRQAVREQLQVAWRQHVGSTPDTTQACAAANGSR